MLADDFGEDLDRMRANARYVAFDAKRIMQGEGSNKIHVVDCSGDGLRSRQSGCRS